MTSVEKNDLINSTTGVTSSTEFADSEKIICEDDTNNNDLTSKIKSLNRFVDLYRLCDDKNPDKSLINLTNPTSVKTWSDLRILSQLLLDFHNDHKIKPFTKELFGRFVVNSDMYGCGDIVHIYKNTSNKMYMFQLSDFPKKLWYTIRCTKDVDNFLKIYDANDANNAKDANPLNNKKVMRYDLKRNSKFTPVMIERYMFSSRFVKGPFKGPFCSLAIMEDASEKLDTFELVTKYYGNALSQDSNKDMFEISGKTALSKSQITIMSSYTGTIVEISYTQIQDSGFRNVINDINNAIGSDFEEDLPIDVVLFLCPFIPIGVRKFINLFNDNTNKFGIAELEIMRQLCVDIINPFEFIAMMKNIDKKLCNKNEKKNDKIDKIDNSDISSIDSNDETENETNTKKLKEIIKTIITQEYLTMIIKDAKKTGNFNKKDRREMIKNLMREVIKLMKKNKDADFLDTNYLKRESKCIR